MNESRKFEVDDRVVLKVGMPNLGVHKNSVGTIQSIQKESGQPTKYEVHFGGVSGVNILLTDIQFERAK